MSARWSFAVYLEAAGPGKATRLMQQRVDEKTIRDARTLWSGQLLGPDITPEKVEAALGAPDHQKDFTMSYALPTRPGFLYVFDFDPFTRCLRSSGFKRSGANIFCPPDEVSSLTQHKLAELGATADEVRSWLGEPSEVYGWWPIETWEYSSGLILEFRHGVVEDIN